MYTLSTCNKHDFDERGTDKMFVDGTEAILEAKRFIKSSTCAGAQAIIFGPHGETVREFRPAPKVVMKWMAPRRWEVIDPFGDLAGQFVSKRAAVWFIHSQGWELKKEPSIKKNPDEDPFKFHLKPSGWTGAPCPICGCATRNLRARHRALKPQEAWEQGAPYMKRVSAAFGTDWSDELLRE